MCKFKFFLFLFVLLFLFITSAFLLAADSWRDKTPDKWDEDEIHQILTDSPWARKATLTFSPLADGLPSEPQTSGGAGERQAQGDVRDSSHGAGDTSLRAGKGGSPRLGEPGRPPVREEAWLHPVIRWQGSEAVRSAYARAGMKAPGSEFIQDYYVVAAIGLLNPDQGSTGSPFSAMEETQTRLQKNSRLYVGREVCLSPERVKIADWDGDFLVLFLFRRTEVGLHDKLRFQSQWGPLSIVADFNPREMQFGKDVDL